MTIHTVQTLAEAAELARANGGKLWRWPDGYWSPADPAKHLAGSTGDMTVRGGRVPPAIARAMSTAYQVVTGLGTITLKGRDQ